MRHMLLFEEYSSVMRKSADEIADYMVRITPNEEDAPDFFVRMIKDAGAEFELKKVRIEDVLEMDPDVEEYVSQGSERYENDYDTEHEEGSIDNPIVIFNGMVIDGYNRLLVKSQSGEEEIDAWVSV
jgi:hypothetical protein